MRGVVYRLMALLWVLGAQAQNAPDLLQVFPPPGAEAPPAFEGPLQPAPAPIRVNRPRRPPFEFRAGDRVVWLDDGCLAGERALGYLETRLTSQFPDRPITFRHLPWLTNSPLARPASGSAEWLGSLLSEVRPLRPTVAILAYGSLVADTGTNALPAFVADYERLLDGLSSLDTNEPLRLVLMGPVARVAVDGDTNRVAAANERLRAATDAIFRLATNRQAEFANLHNWVTAEAAYLKSVGESEKRTFPALTQNGSEPSAFGWSRLALGLERALRWEPNNWRFGMGGNGTLRPGGYGIRLLRHARTTVAVHAETLEQRLPTPSIPGFVDLSETRPQCYIQITGFDPGVYEMRVDGRPVLKGTQLEWARYEIITAGPSWDQAEELRQLIVKKNALFGERWNPDGAARKEAAAGTLPGDEPALRELESQIAKLKKPVQRSYNIFRIPSEPASSPGR